jgi:hypothetical protein
MLITPGLSRLCHLAVASSVLVVCLADCLYSQNDDARPILKHQSAPIQSYGVPDTPSDTYVRRAESAKVEAAPGLVLPDAGHVWALDTISGQPQLVQLKFTLVQANNHLVANRVKAGLAPFVFRPKATWEVPGAAAVVRLHDATPAIFFVMVYGADDAADPKAAMDGFAIVRLQPDEGKRVVGTVTFNQFTAKGKRSEEQIQTKVERVGEPGWYKIVPTEALSPGEYAFVRLPRQSTTMGMNIFDFAIDPDAPPNAKAVLPGVTGGQGKDHE